MKKRLRTQTIIEPDLYVPRDADRQLAGVVEDMGRPGYVLVARQMGKTNLLLNAKRSLAHAQDCFTYVDLSKRFDTERECFRYIIDTVIDGLGENAESQRDAVARIRESSLPPFREYERELRSVLNSLMGKLVIILDEIDSLVRAEFSDTIFAQIRSVYFERVNIREFSRLTYILSGVVDPNEIIKNKRISPFNIGQKIFLDDFTEPEFYIFLGKAGLNLLPEVAERIFEWTKGHPRMTWDICSVVEDVILSGEPLSTERIDMIVRDMYLTDFNMAPVDNIRETISVDDEMRKTVIALKKARAAQVTATMRNKLYLAGVVGALRADRPVAIKNRIVEECLPLDWLEDLGVQNKGYLKAAAEKLEQGEYARALELFEQYVAGGGSLTANDAMGMANSAYAAQKFERAVELYEGLAINPEEQQKTYRLRCLTLAYSYRRIGNAEAAIFNFGEVLRFGRRDVVSIKAFLARGRAFVLTNEKAKWESAINDFNAAVELAKDLAIDIAEDERNKYISSGHYLAGLAMRLLRREGEVEQYIRGLKVSPVWLRPALLQATYQCETDPEKKVKTICELVSNIIDANIVPVEAADAETGVVTFDDVALYLSEAAMHSKVAFDGLFAFLRRIEAQLTTKLETLVLAAAQNALQAGDSSAAGMMCTAILLSDTPASDDFRTQAFPVAAHYAPSIMSVDFNRLYREDLLRRGGGAAFTVSDAHGLVTISVHNLKVSDYQNLFGWADFVRSEQDRIPREFLILFAGLFLQEMTAFERLNMTRKARRAAESLLFFIEQNRRISTVTSPYTSDAILERIKGRAAAITGYGIDGVKLGAAGTPVGRNDRVTVRYTDGLVVTGVKYKKVYSDLMAGRCVVLDAPEGNSAGSFP